MDFLRIYAVFADDAAKLENKIVKAKADMCFPWARTCYKQQEGVSKLIHPLFYSSFTLSTI